MEDLKKERKARKKAYKRAKRKALGLWKGLAITFLILSIIMTPAAYAVSMFDNTIAAFFGGTFWELENKDEDAIYFESDFASAEEMVEYGLEITKQVEAEGAALLMNNNNALPFGKVVKVRCF